MNPQNPKEEIIYARFVNNIFSKYQIAKFVYSNSPKRFTNDFIQDFRLKTLTELSINYTKAIECKDLIISYLTQGKKVGICNGEIITLNK